MLIGYAVPQKHSNHDGYTHSRKDIPVKTEKSTVLTKFVWPWVGVIANLKTDVVPSKIPTGRSRGALRQDLIQRGFKPTKVELVWNPSGHSGFAIVEFGKYLDGFEKAMDFERKFSLDCHGKTEYLDGSSRDDDLYGWVAREEDFNVSGVVGKKLRTKYDLKSVKQLTEEEERKLDQLVPKLPPSVDRESYYEEGVSKIRSDEAKYEAIISSIGDANLDKTAKSGSSGDQSSEDDSGDDSDDEDAPKKKKIKF